MFEVVVDNQLHDFLERFLLILFVATLGAIGSAVTAWLQYKAHKRLKPMDQAQRNIEELTKVLTEVNDAVNHKHEKRGPDAMKMYDLVWETHEKVDEVIQWKRSYDGGPLDMGHKVVNFVDRMEESCKKIEELEIVCKGLKCQQCPSEIVE